MHFDHNSKKINHCTYQVLIWNKSFNSSIQIINRNGFYYCRDKFKWNLYSSLNPTSFKIMGNGGYLRTNQFILSIKIEVYEI